MFIVLALYKPLIIIIFNRVMSYPLGCGCSWKVEALGMQTRKQSQQNYYHTAFEQPHVSARAIEGFGCAWLIEIYLVFWIINVMCHFFFYFEKDCWTRSAWQRSGFLGGTRLAKIAKVLREFLSLICTTVEYSEIWGLNRKSLQKQWSLILQNGHH